MRVAVVGHGHFPLTEPFAGGLEAFTWRLVRGLRGRGHEVVLYAAEGTDPALADELVTFATSPAALGPRRPARREDAPDPVDHPETRAYLAVVADLVARGDAVDVVANHSLQPTTVALSAALGPAVVTTFHTPLLEPVAAAIALADHRARYTAVSRATARAWAPAGVDPLVIHNGVDAEVFRAGPGGPRACWVGRLTPDKGADLAVAAARRAGIGLDIVGPVSDPDWYDDVLRPLLGSDVRHLGPLDQEASARVVGASAVALVTPRWEEPFGLVAAEALMCGTPVVALARGAMPEIVGQAGVVVAPRSGAEGLAAGIEQAASVDREYARNHALQHFSIERMVDDYERLYASVASTTRQVPPS